MSHAILARAALRLSSRMLAYHLKRAFRNWFAGRFPRAYSRHINRASNRLPKIAKNTSGISSLARQVSRYYRFEYDELIDQISLGRLSYFGHQVDFGDIALVNWHHQIGVEEDFHLWRMKLAQMGFVCSLLTSGKRSHLKAVEKALAGFREFAAFDRTGCFSSYWFPYSASHRILAILSGLVLVRERGDIPRDLNQQVGDFLRWNAGFVLANIEHELKNNHVERNLAAICFYLACCEDVPPRLASMLDREISRYLHSCILDDGFQIERSAMYQGLTVMALHVFAGAAFLSTATRAHAAKCAAKAEHVLAIMTHPDGDIALFNDSWIGETPPLELPPDGSPSENAQALESAGYVRLERGNFFLLFDAGPIGPPWNPGHGHADFLSIELDVVGVRFLVDPGTFQYSTGRRRDYERRAASHNGPTITSREPIEYLGCFKVGRLTEAQLDFFSGDCQSLRAAGSCDWGECAMRRELCCTQNVVHVVDTWSSNSADAQVRLLIQGEWSIAQSTDHTIVFERGNERAVVRVSKGRIDSCRKAAWARRYLVSEDATEILLLPECIEGAGARLVWQVDQA